MIGIGEDNLSSDLLQFLRRHGLDVAHRPTGMNAGYGFPHAQFPEFRCVRFRFRVNSKLHDLYLTWRTDSLNRWAWRLFNKCVQFRIHIGGATLQKRIWIGRLVWFSKSIYYWRTERTYFELSLIGGELFTGFSRPLVYSEIHRGLMRESTICICLAIAIMCVLFLPIARLCQFEAGSDNPKGDVPTDLLGQTLDGHEIRLHDFKGKVVLIIFWKVMV